MIVENNRNETFVERLRRESAGCGSKDKKLEDKEAYNRPGNLLALVKKLGRPITGAEWESLQNII
jgi:hypothetical protein